MCEDYSYLGSRTDGGFAEYVKVPVWNLMEIPDGVTFEEAAMLEPLAVGLHALRQLPADEIHSITIIGLGPIGLMMAQWARQLGIEQILLVGNKEQQMALAEQTGFRLFFNSKHTSPAEWIAEQTHGLGTDAVVDCVGSSEVLTLCLNTVKSKGHILIVGNPKGDLSIPKNSYWKIHRKQLSLHGTWNSGYKCTDETKDDWKTAMQAMQNKEIDVKKLITHKLPFEELEKGLLMMRDKKEFYCKVMVIR
jgi:L-iditol 2-dehydrogenase